MVLFGGVVGWRANKQDTVTTSTTEAELLALSQATKEALFASRLLKEIGLTFDDTALRIWCDNSQTIRLVNAEIATLTTKLKHVDIHNHWLRERKLREEISVAYVSTENQLADGLTKALDRTKFDLFRAQMGLEDVKDHVQEKRLREITQETLEEMEDWFEGGEADYVG
jgi:hypothetical protein